MMLAMIFLYWLEAFLTASIFIGAVGVTYLAGKALRMAYRAVHKPSKD